LGSSACLIIGLISSYLYLKKMILVKDEILKYSLMIHYDYQNKIGSGYDIFTSIYGTNLF
jgi:phosphomevalonate kinase